MINGTLSNDETVEGSKQAVVTDLKNAVGDAGNLVNSAAAATADEFARARTKLDDRLDQAKSRLIDAGQTVSDKARYTADATDQFVRDNPWKVLGVAAAAGLVIGAMLSRR